MAKRNTFTKTTGSTYTCSTCGRRTRNTGEQSVGSDLCPQCWELAGIENEISDGTATIDERAAVISGLVAQIREKGGDPKEFADLIAKIDAPKTTPSMKEMYTAEVVNLKARRALTIEHAQRLLVNDAHSVHLGHNLGNVAHEITDLNARIEQMAMVLRSLETK